MHDFLREFYDDEPFVAVSDEPPATKSVLGSNAAHVTARYDSRTGTVIAMCAIDNLTKGASGGACSRPTSRSASTRQPACSTIGLAP